MTNMLFSLYSLCYITKKSFFFLFFFIVPVFEMKLKPSVPWTMVTTNSSSKETPVFWWATSYQIYQEKLWIIKKRRSGIREIMPFTPKSFTN